MIQPKKAKKLSKLRGCLALLLYGVGALLIVAAIGWAYEHYASAEDPKRYPPPGKLIAIDGRLMHLNCTGEGAPTVVLDTQAPSTSIDWALVQPEIAKFTRVCSYDRAGYGWSEAGPLPRSAGQEASDLDKLLSASGEPGPYLLVGASYGGHVVRIFANEHPEKAVGMVLVDPRPEKLFSIPSIRQQADSSLVSVDVLAALTDFGLARLFILLMPEKMIPAAAVPVYAALPGSYAIVFQSRMWHATAAEAHAMDASDVQVAAIQSMGDLPLIVLRHGLPMASLTAENEEKWKIFQEEIAALSTAGQVIVAENSDHAIQLHQPEIIVDSVRKMRDATAAPAAP